MEETVVVVVGLGHPLHCCLPPRLLAHCFLFESNNLQYKVSENEHLIPAASSNTRNLPTVLALILVNELTLCTLNLAMMSFRTAK